MSFVVYTYSTIADFPRGLASGQLATEISADPLITTVLDRIDTSNDTVFIVFVSALSSPELTELNVLIAAHTPAPTSYIITEPGYIQLISTLADSQAIQIKAINTNGGIAMTSGLGGTAISSTNAIALTGGAASSFTTSLGNLSLISTAGVAILEGGSGVTVGNDTLSTPILIGTTAHLKTITIGNSTSSSSIAIVSGTGNTAVSSTGTITMASTASSSSAITLDSSVSGGGVNIIANTGGFTVNSGAGKTQLVSTNTSVDAIRLDTSGSSGGIFLAAGSNGIQIGNDGVAKTIVIGNTTGSTALTLQAGGGGISIGNDAVAKTITIGNTTGATGVTIQGGTGPINIGFDFVAKAITLGTGTGSTSVTLYSGAGGITLQALSGGSTSIYSSNTTVDAIRIDSSPASGGVFIAAGTQGIQIGNDGIAKTIVIGNTTGTSGITIQGGTNPITIGDDGIAKTVVLGNTTGSSKLKLRTGATGYQINTQVTPTSLADSNATLTMDNTAATGLFPQLLSGTPTSTRTLTLPSAANAVAAISGVAVSDAFDFTIINLAAAGTAVSFQVAAGANGSIIGRDTVDPYSNGAGTYFNSGTGKFRIVFTNVSSGTETYILYRMS